MSDLSFVERVALFLKTLHKAEAGELLEGFVEAKRYTANQFCRHFGRFDSPTRQARLAREFGVQPEALERLRQVVARSPPRLQSAIVETLPEPWRRAFPRLKPRSTSPALRNQARRLIHETVR